MLSLTRTVFLLVSFCTVSSLDKLQVMQETIDVLSRQLMDLQLRVEEMTRNERDSGIVQVRHKNEGTRIYHSDAEAGPSIASIHDHADHIATIGMGEVAVNLNGVSFRTRHNDYALRMPHRTSSEFRATEEIPFPPVPDSVTEQPTIELQVKEMQEYFRAWELQNKTHRNYTSFFKPVLSYLEGYWTIAGKIVEEPFDSDRHFIDATTWQELMSKIRYTSYTGGKNPLENLAYLPTTIQYYRNGTVPIVAQWNYRILCHPLKDDLPLNRFRVVDDIGKRMDLGRNLEQYERSRAARFQLNPFDTDTFKRERRTNYGLLDKLMSEIPGANNYKGLIHDEEFDGAFQTFEGDQPLNAAYYHSWFRRTKNDAMGLKNNHRGFSDASLFMATTTQNKVAGLSTTDCVNGYCKEVHQKWTYAIPLEIIYLNPLAKWNPYNLKYKGLADTQLGRTVTANGADGSSGKPLHGINSKRFYMTPVALYDNEVGRDPADTAANSVSVLDPKGVTRNCRASGVRIFIPNIPGVGSLRQRYPIMSFSSEGSSIRKELEGLKNIVLEPAKYENMIRNTNAQSSGGLVLVTSRASARQYNHVHTVYLTDEQVRSLKEDELVTTNSSYDYEHSHTLVIQYLNGNYMIQKCDKNPIRERCSDGHGNRLFLH